MTHSHMPESIARAGTRVRQSEAFDSGTKFERTSKTQ